MEQYNTVFAVLKSALWGEPLVMDGTEDWGAVFQELRDQGVDGLTADALAQTSDLELRQKSMQHTLHRMRFFHRLMKEQAALTDLFQTEDIPWTVLKGAAAAMYYPQADYRAMGDVDILVRPADFDRALGVMIANGFEIVGEDDGRHIELKRNGILFELHRYFAIMTDQEAARKFDKALYDRLGEETASIGAYTFPVLPTVENGLVLLMHINQHLESGLGLRQIIDWMLFVDRELDDALWESEFAARAEQIGLKTLAVAMTRMCQLYLGLREQGITWCAGADESLCTEALEIIMKHGNFGRKGGVGKAVTVLSAASSLGSFFSRLQTRGCVNWAALKKYPFLKPFAWLYQICRYVRKGFAQEHPLRQLWKDMGQVGHQDDIMTRLGVTRRAKETSESKVRE